MPVKTYAPLLIKMSFQVWLSGSVLADGLIALSMIYHVSPWHLYSKAHLTASDSDCSLLPTTQLERRRTDGHGFLSNSAISRIVRLTIETNLITSKRI